MVDTTGAIWRAEPFRDDALAAKRAGVLEDDRAVAAKVLIERDAFMAQPQKAGKPPFTMLDRFGANVLAIDR
jgi:hypothetical protein